jgi:hypothetical protein
MRYPAVHPRFFFFNFFYFLSYNLTTILCSSCSYSIILMVFQLYSLFPFISIISPILHHTFWKVVFSIRIMVLGYIAYTGTLNLPYFTVPSMVAFFFFFCATRIWVYKGCHSPLSQANSTVQAPYHQM